MKEPTNSFYQKTVLDNGLRIITEKIPHVRSIAIGVWVTVGSRDENAHNNGISHFIEHLVFKGTEKRDARQIAESLESVGGHLDAFTGKELCCFQAHILDEHLPLAVDVLSDLLLHPVFDPVEMEKEKEVIVREITHTKDTPDELVFEYFYENVFDSHPLGYLISGTQENVLRFTRQEAIDFMKEHYTSERTVVAAAGNVEHDQLVELVEKNFAGLNSTHKTRTLVPVPEPSTSTKEQIIDNNCTQAHICLGTRAYSYSHAQKFALLVIHTLLGGGMSSRLFQNIREKYGLAYAIFTFPDFFMDTGLFGVYIATMAEKIDLAKELIKQEFTQLTTNPVEASELERIKSQLKGNLMLGLESTIGRMNRLASAEIYLNRFTTLDDTIEKIQRVTAEQIMEVANELFQQDRFFTTILKPAKT